MLYIIEVYETKEGKHPFNEWLIRLKDTSIRQKIRVRLERLALGNLSNSNPIAYSIHEIKLDFAGGYRVYFANISLNKILILCAGMKRTQDQDISRAKSYFIDYKMRGKSYGEK